MNRRCENNIQDFATNVCDSCYGEFCDECLVKLRTRKYPLCTDCAVITSGVRGSSKPRLLGDKRTARSRRKEIINAKNQKDQNSKEATSAKAAASVESKLAATDKYLTSFNEAPELDPSKNQARLSADFIQRRVFSKGSKKKSTEQKPEETAVDDLNLQDITYVSELDLEQDVTETETKKSEPTEASVSNYSDWIRPENQAPVEELEPLPTVEEIAEELAIGDPVAAEIPDSDHDWRNQVPDIDAATYQAEEPEDVAIELEEVDLALEEVEEPEIEETDTTDAIGPEKELTDHDTVEHSEEPDLSEETHEVEAELEPEPELEQEPELELELEQEIEPEPDQTEIELEEDSFNEEAINEYTNQEPQDTDESIWEPLEEEIEAELEEEIEEEIEAELEAELEEETATELEEETATELEPEPELEEEIDAQDDSVWEPVEEPSSTFDPITAKYSSGKAPKPKLEEKQADPLDPILAAYGGKSAFGSTKEDQESRLSRRPRRRSQFWSKREETEDLVEDANEFEDFEPVAAGPLEEPNEVEQTQEEVEDDSTYEQAEVETSDQDLDDEVESYDEAPDEHEPIQRVKTATLDTEPESQPADDSKSSGKIKGFLNRRKRRSSDTPEENELIEVLLSTTSDNLKPVVEEPPEEELLHYTRNKNRRSDDPFEPVEAQFVDETEDDNPQEADYAEAE